MTSKNNHEHNIFVVTSRYTCNLLQNIYKKLFFNFNKNKIGT